MKIGVLALQGAIAEHLKMVERSGAEAIPIKKVEQLNEIDGLVIPGGESTTIGKLMRTYGFIDALKQHAEQGMPLFGTCAGLIVIAKEIVGQEQAHLELMDMAVIRNAFGRQKESFEADLSIDGLDEPFRAVFIRAPIIESVGPDVEVISTYRDQIVAARQNNLLAASFHPELTEDHRFHAYFVDMVRAKSESK